MTALDPVRATIAQVDEALDRIDVGESTDLNVAHFHAAIGYLRSAVLQLADRIPTTAPPQDWSECRTAWDEPSA
jgi:hypothetical protein